MSMHEALEAELAAFKGTPAVLTFQSGLHGQHRGHPDHHRRDRPDRLATRSTTPRSSTACASRRRRARSTRTPTSRRCARSSARRARAAGRDGGRAVPADPGRHRRRVLDGRRHRATPRDRRGGRGVRGGRDGRRRPRHRASSGATGAARSTTSACTAGSRSRSARCRRRSASLGGYVAGSQALREILTQRARPFLFSTSPSAGRRGGLPRGDPGDAGRARAASSGCGPTPGASRRS